MNQQSTAIADLFSLHGKTALVTGAAGGLGSAISGGFEEAGARVVRTDRAVDDQRDIQALDVTESAQIREFVASLHEDGGIDVLVNCAGIAFRHPAESYPDDAWDLTMNVNLRGTFLLCREVGRTMLQRGSGSIINLASIASLVGYPHSTAYIQSKGGVAQLTRSLAVEWAPRGVRVNAIAPSVFETGMVSAADDADSTTSAWHSARTPIGRVGQPKEIVGPAIFLASEASSMVTGHILAVDGGYTAA